MVIVMADASAFKLAAKRKTSSECESGDLHRRESQLFNIQIFASKSIHQTFENQPLVAMKPINCQFFWVIHQTLCSYRRASVTKSLESHFQTIYFFIYVYLHVVFALTKSYNFSFLYCYYYYVSVSAKFFYFAICLLTVFFISFI